MRPFLQFEAKRKVSTASGLDSGAAPPSLLSPSPEKEKSNIHEFIHILKCVQFIGDHLFKGSEGLMLYGGKNPVKPRTLVAFPGSCEGSPGQLLGVETIPGEIKHTSCISQVL